MFSRRRRWLTLSAVGSLAVLPLAGCGEQRGDAEPTPTKATAHSDINVSVYETMYWTFLDALTGRSHLDAKSAADANQQLGLDERSGFRYLTFDGGSWCVTDGTAVLSFDDYGMGAATLYTDASATPTADDCATLTSDWRIPADVKVAFRTDDDGDNLFHLVKGDDLVSERIVSRIENGA